MLLQIHEILIIHFIIVFLSATCIYIVLYYMHIYVMHFMSLMLSCSPIIGEEFSCLVPQQFNRLSFYVCDGETMSRDPRMCHSTFTKEELLRSHEFSAEKWFPLYPVTQDSEVQVNRTRWSNYGLCICFVMKMVYNLHEFLVHRKHYQFVYDYYCQLLKTHTSLSCILLVVLHLAQIPSDNKNLCDSTCVYMSYVKTSPPSYVLLTVYINQPLYIINETYTHLVI